MKTGVLQLGCVATLAVSMSCGGEESPIGDTSLPDVPSADIPLSDVPSADIPLSDVPSADIPSVDALLGEAFQALGTVTEGGGKLCAGELCLDFPAGAVTGAVEVQARLADAGTVPADFSLVGPTFEIKASVEQFAVPITLTLPLPPGVAADELLVLSRDSAGDEAQRTLFVPVSSGGGLAVQTTHLSRWSVLLPVRRNFQPVGLATDPSGDLYVMDTYRDSLQRRSSPTDPTPLVLGSSGAGERQFNDAQGVALGPEGKILVADTGNDRIVQVDDMTGAGWTMLGSHGAGTNQFDSPSGIAVTPVGKILVADKGNCRLIQMDDITGRGWTTLGGCGAGQGELNGPSDVELLPSGKILVADRGNARVVQIDDITGSGWTSFDIAGADLGGLAAGPDGRIYLSDVTTGRLLRMDDITGRGSADLTPAFEFHRPVRLAVAANGSSLFVASENLLFGLNFAPDRCPDDRDKTAPGACGCGVAEDLGDDDGDGLVNCLDLHATQGCTCFTLSQVAELEARDGATCVLGGVIGDYSPIWGVVLKHSADVTEYAAAGKFGDAYQCLLGCEDLSAAGGCQALGAALLQSSPIEAAESDACADLITAGCLPPPPGKPTNVTAQAPTGPGSTEPLAGRISVSFTPPADGGASIDRYTVTATLDGAFAGTATGASSPIVVDGLLDCTKYTFTVTAHNASGESAPSDAASAWAGVSAPPMELTWADTYMSNDTLYWSTSFGACRALDCPGPAPQDPGAVTGTGRYTGDSHLCAAAVHAGVITLAAGGTFVWVPAAGYDQFPASTQNGITSNSWPRKFPVTFVIVEPY